MAPASWGNATLESADGAALRTLVLHADATVQGRPVGAPLHDSDVCDSVEKDVGGREGADLERPVPAGSLPCEVARGLLPEERVIAGGSLKALPFINSFAIFIN